MPDLFLVRHAQASFFSASYDELSPLGLQQATALGEHWARAGVAFEAVYVGPRRRHRQTAERVAAAYAERGLAFPAVTALAELDEHHGATIIKARLGEDPTNPALATAAVDAADRERAIREFFRAYNEIMREWARGEHGLEGVESWAGFRARTLRGLDLMCAGPGSGPRVAFTSGGFVSSAAGWLLGLDEDRVIDLSLVVRNTSLTEVGWSSKRRRLVAFNALPHCGDASLVTSV